MSAGARNAAAQPRAVDDRNSDEKLRPLVSAPLLASPWGLHSTSPRTPRQRSHSSRSAGQSSGGLSPRRSSASPREQRATTPATSGASRTGSNGFNT